MSAKPGLWGNFYVIKKLRVWGREVCEFEWGGWGDSKSQQRMG